MQASLFVDLSAATLPCLIRDSSSPRAVKSMRTDSNALLNFQCCKAMQCSSLLAHCQRACNNIFMVQKVSQTCSAHTACSLVNSSCFRYCTILELSASCSSCMIFSMPLPLRSSSASKMASKVFDFSSRKARALLSSMCTCRRQPCSRFSIMLQHHICVFALTGNKKS